MKNGNWILDLCCNGHFQNAHCYVKNYGALSKNFGFYFLNYRMNRKVTGILFFVHNSNESM